jgi:hypothetical protein
MSYRADLTAFSAQGELALVVEAKTKLHATPGWAAAMRRNLLAHGTHPKTKYFLLATPDRFYLWLESGTARPDRLPDAQIDARNLLAPYFARAGTAPSTVSGDGFELVVAAWLHDLVDLGEPPAELRKSEPVLSELFEDLRGGHVTCEETV